MSRLPIYKDFKKWGRQRNLVQLAILFTFFILPLPQPFPGLEHGLLRFNFVDWRIHFFSLTLVPGLFHIFYLAFIIPLFALAVFSSLYGKVFCGWVCPQNIFYEIFEGIHNELKKHSPRYRHSTVLQKTVDFSMALAWGLLLAYWVQLYFIGAHPIFQTVSFGAVAIFFTLDAHWWKHDFCKNACPYAHLQKAFQKQNSLHVEWEDRPGNRCGVCTACEKACYVDINIRETPFHLDCTMCGACVDACARVFSRKEEPSLLSFSFDTEEKKSWGLWGINTLPKLFTCLAFLSFLSFFAYMIYSRPLVDFRIDYPTGGGSYQLPVVRDGVHTNFFTLHVRSLSAKSEGFTLNIIEPGYELIWKDPASSIAYIPAFERESAEIEVHYRPEEGEELFLFQPIHFELRRKKNEKLMGTRELYFKPAET